jgi:hypothetical protein
MRGKRHVLRKATDMKMPVQSPPVQRDLLISESHRKSDGIQAAQGPGGPFGIFGPGGPFASIPGLAPQPPHITYEINTWLQAVPLEAGSAGCSRLLTAHRIG